MCGRHGGAVGQVYSKSIYDWMDIDAVAGGH